MAEKTKVLRVAAGYTSMRSLEEIREDAKKYEGINLRDEDYAYFDEIARQTAANAAKYHREGWSTKDYTTLKNLISSRIRKLYP